MGEKVMFHTEGMLLKKQRKSCQGLWESKRVIERKNYRKLKTENVLVTFHIAGD